MNGTIELKKLGRDDAWPLALIAALVLLAALPSLLGMVSSDPAVYAANMAINAHAPSAPVSAPFLPGGRVIDGNTGYTTEALGYRAAMELLHGRMPWWNPYTGVGLPLAAEYQPAAFFPLTVLLLLPKGVLLESLLLQMLAGWGVYALLRQLGLHRLAAVTGGILFAFNGTSSFFGLGGVALPLPFLPWMLLGVERGWTKAALNLYGGWRTLAVASALTLLAGFPEAAYLNGLMVLAWSSLRLFQILPDKRLAYGWRIALGGTVGIALATPQIFVFFQSLPLSYALAHTALSQADVHVSLGAVVPSLVAPYIWPLSASGWQGMGGYVTAAMLITASYGFLARRSPLAWLLLVWVVFALGKMFGLQPMTFVWNLVPGVTETWTSRYIPPTWSLAIMILAAFGIDDLIRANNRRRWPTLAALLVTLIVVSGSLALGLYLWKATASAAVVRPYIIPALIWTVVSAAISLGMFAWPTQRSSVVLACLLAIESVLMFSIPTLASPPGDVTVDMPGIQFLRQNLGLNRFYTLGPITPNYSAYYGIASIDMAYLPVAKKWLDWIHSHLDRVTLSNVFVGDFSFRDLVSPSPLEELERNLIAFEWTGVKYVVTYRETSFTNSLPKGITPQTSQALKAIKKVYADRAMTIYELPRPSPYFEIVSGRCNVAAHGRTKAVTDCAVPATLLRRELYYPGWNARVGDTKAEISAYGDLFQSVALPKGRSIVSFDYSPPHIVWMWLVALLGMAALGVSGFGELRLRKNP